MNAVTKHRVIAGLAFLGVFGVGAVAGGASGGAAASAPAETVTQTQTVPGDTTTVTATKTITQAPPAPTGPKGFGDGVWLVPKEMTPGTYRAPGGGSCYYEVDRDFSGGLNSIITNDVDVKNPVVTIPSAAKGFNTQSCGEWTKIS